MFEAIESLIDEHAALEHELAQPEDRKSVV